MDEFYRDVYVSIFKAWILIQHYDKITITQSPEDHNIIKITAPYGEGVIGFYEHDIIAMSARSSHKKNDDFFLHFQMTNLKHAVSLFNEMITVMQSFIMKPKTNILLVCTGGMTTGYFAEELQKGSDLLGLSYNLQATSYAKLYNQEEDYEAILLAPQIAYLYATVKAIFKEKTVLKIPTAVFAKYDVRKMLNIIQKHLEKAPSPTVTLNPLTVTDLNSNQHILCVSLFRDSEQVHISYRLYGEKGQILLNNETIKNAITMQDLYDMLNTVLTRYPDIDMIGFSAPGIIYEGEATTANIKGFYQMNYKALFAKYYTQKFLIQNDVNAAAIGYHYLHPDIRSVVVLFQPISTYAGAGTVVNGHLITGKHSIAGEVQFYPFHQIDHLKVEPTPERLLEIVRNTVMSFITTIGPEHMCIYCTLLPTLDELRAELEKYIPKEYIPTLEKVEDLQEYIFVGLLASCLNKLT